jgi:hypothetical protein
MRVYREIEEQQLIELPNFEYRVSDCLDGFMIMFDRDLNKHTIDSVEKFIEIEFNRADKNGLECFVQVAEEPGFKMIVGIKICASQVA